MSVSSFGGDSFNSTNSPGATEQSIQSASEPPSQPRRHRPQKPQTKPPITQITVNSQPPRREVKEKRTRARGGQQQQLVPAPFVPAVFWGAFKCDAIYYYELTAPWHRHALRFPNSTKEFAPQFIAAAYTRLQTIALQLRKLIGLFSDGRFFWGKWRKVDNTRRWRKVLIFLAKEK